MAMAGADGKDMLLTLVFVLAGHPAETAAAFAWVWSLAWLPAVVVEVVVVDDLDLAS